MKVLSKIFITLFSSSVCILAGTTYKYAPESEVADIPWSSNLKPYIGGSLGTKSINVQSSSEVCGGCDYDKVNQTSTKLPSETVNWGGDDRTTLGTLILGLEVNRYLALEGRYTKGLHDYEIENHKPISATDLEFYLKPQYKFSHATVYALTGYGKTEVDFMNKETSETSFRYGAGASYDMNEYFSFFADYTTPLKEELQISDITKMDSSGNARMGLIFRPW